MMWAVVQKHLEFQPVTAQHTNCNIEFVIRDPEPIREKRSYKELSAHLLYTEINKILLGMYAQANDPEALIFCEIQYMNQTTKLILRCATEADRIRDQNTKTQDELLKKHIALLEGDIKLTKYINIFNRADIRNIIKIIEKIHEQKNSHTPTSTVEPLTTSSSLEELQELLEPTSCVDRMRQIREQWSARMLRGLLRLRS